MGLLPGVEKFAKVCSSSYRVARGGMREAALSQAVVKHGDRRGGNGGIDRSSPVQGVNGFGRFDAVFLGGRSNEGGGGEHRAAPRSAVAARSGIRDRGHL